MLKKAELASQLYYCQKSKHTLILHHLPIDKVAIKQKEKSKELTQRLLSVFRLHLIL